MQQNPATEEVKPCLIKDCETKPAEKRRWKGLCPACYGCAKKVMKEEGLSWKELAAFGLAELDEKPFYRAFKEARKKAGETVVNTTAETITVHDMEG